MISVFIRGFRTIELEVDDGFWTEINNNGILTVFNGENVPVAQFAEFSYFVRTP